MSSENRLCNNQHFITGNDLLEALLKNLNGKCTKEELRKKIIELGVDIEGTYLLVEIVNKVSTSSITMTSEDEDYEANWVEALRQLAVGLNDDESLQVIAAAKRSMEAAHSRSTFGSAKKHSRDLNNNLVNTSSSSASFDSIRKSDKEEQKKKETELLKIIKNLNVHDEPLTPTQSEDIKIEEEIKEKDEKRTL